ncbi:hypothetical protein CFAM422_013261 [Trichoderma lentiforme]|uniref:Uncharacterized protein n=1 Tax=Trichoderma lentiforme TaxID=1567552 RepID=A0A9P4X351_9HYPO|nr:hypothetical protein CFAM422_013261 [Trichoderma lentiforme]
MIQTQSPPASCGTTTSAETPANTPAPDCKPWNVGSYCIVSEGRLASFKATASKAASTSSKSAAETATSKTGPITTSSKLLLLRPPLLLPLPLLSNLRGHYDNDRAYAALRLGNLQSRILGSSVKICAKARLFLGKCFAHEENQEAVH